MSGESVGDQGEPIMTTKARVPSQEARELLAAELGDTPLASCLQSDEPVSEFGPTVQAALRAIDAALSPQGVSEDAVEALKRAEKAWTDCDGKTSFMGILRLGDALAQAARALCDSPQSTASSPKGEA